MQEGAFALIDCLGWKGIWRQRANYQVLLQKIDGIQKKIVERKGEFVSFVFKAKIRVRPRIAFLSDTIAISVPLVTIPEEKVSKSVREGFAVEVASVIVAELLDLYIDEQPFITMRGVITYGEHVIKRNILVGPAVDEAADNFERADGAFVWLVPSASERLRTLYDWKYKLVDDLVSKTHAELQPEAVNRMNVLFRQFADAPVVIHDYLVPLRDGRSLACPVINPLCMLRESETRARTIERYITSFGAGQTDVLIKKQNTLLFLSHASDATLEFYDQKFDDELIEKLRTGLSL